MNSSRFPDKTASMCIGPPLTCMLVIALFHSTPASARDSDASGSEDAEELTEIIVTGSRIPRRDYFSLSPIVSVDRREIALTGNLQINHLLNSLPQFDPGFGAGTANNIEGASRINLRGLGDSRTLTLLNGRRYANSGVFGATDLNSLPPVMIERVEVITGGASAVYGSDAVAGAVNFILRNDFDGLDVSVQYGISDRGDAESSNIDLAYGTPFAAGNGHVTVFVNHYDRTAVFQNARAISRVPLFANNQTGEIESNESFISGAGLIDDFANLDLYTFDPDGRPRLFIEPDDLYNYASENALLAPLTRTSAGVFGQLEFTNNVSASLELIYTRSEPELLRPDAFFGAVSVNTDRPDISQEFRDLLATNHDPDGDGIAQFDFGRRFTVDRGSVTTVNDRDYLRAMLAFSGQLGSSWRWGADYSYTHTDRQGQTFNDVSKSRLQQGLLVDPITGGCFDPSNGCVPVNPFGAGNLSANAAAFIGLEESQRFEDATEQVINASLGGSPITNWAGDIDLVVGALHRDFDAHFFPSESLLNGDSVYWGFDFDLGGEFSVTEAFVESRIPIVVGAPWAEYLGLEVGARISDYDVIDGEIDTWKIGAEWETVYGLRLRGMFQRAIRAPGVAELFQDDLFAGFFFGLGPIFDQCSASRDPVANGLEDLCIAQGIPPDQLGIYEATFFPTTVEFSANPELGAEEANTFTAGIVWQPDTQFPLSVSFDYFNIELDNAITIVQPSDALELCFALRNLASPFCQTITRGPDGNIATAQLLFFNSAFAVSEGVDFALDMNWDVPDLATFGPDATVALSVRTTHFIKVGTQPTQLSPFFECPGRFGALCNDFVFLGSMPEFRGNSRLTYTSGPVSTSLRWSFVDGMQNSENEFRELTGQPPGMPAVRDLPSKNYFDLTIDADLGDMWYLTLGVVNLLDEDPPFIGDNAFGAANTDPRTYDVIGRRYFFRVGLSF